MPISVFPFAEYGRSLNDNIEENNMRDAKRTREEIETPTILLEDNAIPSHQLRY